jgi:hypothetical protein
MTGVPLPLVIVSNRRTISLALCGRSFGWRTD